MNKNEIRLGIKTRKALLSEQEKTAAACAAFAMLEKQAAFMMAEHILMYHSLPDELSTHNFLEKWQGRKHFYLPRVNGVNLEILPYEKTSLKLGAFHIEEPDGNDTVDVSHMELIIVPAVAYDRKGNRVGRGKGFYDRLLATTRAIKIGMSYDFQIVDEIDVDPHDVGVDLIITDKDVYKVK